MSTISIFYDRKHNCEVTSEQLMPIKLVVSLAVTEDDYESSEKHLIGSHESPLGSIGYKSPKCHKSQNWDRWLNYTDLVFLRFEWREEF